MLKSRLTTILAADIVGYTRIMADDEAAALRAMDKLRGPLFEAKVEEHDGQILKRMGDGWLVTFANVADAVEAGMKIQDGLQMTVEKLIHLMENWNEVVLWELQ